MQGKSAKEVVFQPHFFLDLFAHLIENHYLYIVVKIVSCTWFRLCRIFQATAFSSRLMTVVFIFCRSLSHVVCSMPLSYSGYGFSLVLNRNFLHKG